MKVTKKSSPQMYHRRWRSLPEAGSLFIGSISLRSSAREKCGDGTVPAAPRQSGARPRRALRAVPRTHSIRRTPARCLMAEAASVTEGRRTVAALQLELGKVILGKPAVIDDMLVALL